MAAKHASAVGFLSFLAGGPPLAAILGDPVLGAGLPAVAATAFTLWFTGSLALTATFGRREV